MGDLLPTLSYFFRGPVAPRFAWRRLFLAFVSSMALALPTQRTTQHYLYRADNRTADHALQQRFVGAYFQCGFCRGHYQ